MEFKRFICFKIMHYYPYGGMDDAKTSFDTLEETTKWLEDNREKDDGCNWSIHAFDCETKQIIRYEKDGN